MEEETYIEEDLMNDFEDNHLELEDIELINQDEDKKVIRLILKDGTWKYLSLPTQLFNNGNSN